MYIYGHVTIETCIKVPDRAHGYTTPSFQRGRFLEVVRMPVRAFQVTSKRPCFRWTLWWCRLKCF